MEDVLLPAIADPRLTDDTVVFVMEHDFRFYQRDDEKPSDWLPLVGDLDPASVDDDVWDVLPGQVRAHKNGLRTLDRDLVESSRRGRFGAMLAATRPQPGDAVSPELADLVSYCNQARKHGRDGLVWMGWNAGDPESTATAKRTSHIRFGSQLIALTPPFARLLLPLMRAESHPQHIDLWLKHTLINSEELNALSCYVQPAIGGFASSHTSMNLQRPRKGPWNERWCQQGTNPHNSGPSRPGVAGRRWLLRFQKAGQPAYFGDFVPVPYEDEGLFHKTLRPPDSLRTADDQFRFLVHSMGWMTPTDGWLGPWFTETILWKEPAWKGQGKCAMLTRRELMLMTPPMDHWRRLQEHPEERPPRDGVHPDRLISRLAFEVATSSGAGHTWHHDSRAGRERRFAREQYRQRYFVDDASEAFPGKKHMGPPVCVCPPAQEKQQAHPSPIPQPMPEPNARRQCFMPCVPFPLAEPIARTDRNRGNLVGRARIHARGRTPSSS